jgi:hypothetical protein
MTNAALAEVLKGLEKRIIAGEFKGRAVCINNAGELVTPREGQWFCEFDLPDPAIDLCGQEIVDGALVEYVGEGQFYEEHSDEPHRQSGIAYVLQG